MSSMLVDLPRGFGRHAPGGADLPTSTVTEVVAARCKMRDTPAPGAIFQAIERAIARLRDRIVAALDSLFQARTEAAQESTQAEQLTDVVTEQLTLPPPRQGGEWDAASAEHTRILQERATLQAGIEEALGKVQTITEVLTSEAEDLVALSERMVQVEANIGAIEAVLEEEDSDPHEDQLDREYDELGRLGERAAQVEQNVQAIDAALAEQEAAVAQLRRAHDANLQEEAALLAVIERLRAQGGGE